MANLLSQFGNWNAGVNTKIFGTAEELTKFGKSMGGLGINAGNIGGIANTIGQIGTGLLAGQNETGIGNAMQTIGGLASNIPGVGGLIGAGVGVVGGLVNAAFGSHINDEFVQQTQLGANQLASQSFNANTNGDLLSDWQNTTQMGHVSKSDVGSDGWFSSKASDKTDELNRKIDEANKRLLANFGLAAENVDAQNDLRILQNISAYGGPINSFRKYYDKGGYLSQAKALIRQNEGWREKPYSDAPKGKNWRSVGYGFNDSGFREKYPEGISKHYEHGITKKQAEEELDYFLNKAEKQLKSIYGKQWNAFTDSQKAAILDTYYQRPASVGKGSRFYKAVTAGEDAGRYLGVAGFDKRNKIRQGVFGGSQDYVNLGAETENPSANSSSLQEVTPFTPVVQGLDLSGITPTQAKALELNLTSPIFDLSMFGGTSTPQESHIPTIGTVEDFLASYGDFDDMLFAQGGFLGRRYAGEGNIPNYLAKPQNILEQTSFKNEPLYGGSIGEVVVTGRRRPKQKSAFEAAIEEVATPEYIPEFTLSSGIEQIPFASKGMETGKYYAPLSMDNNLKDNEYLNSPQFVEDTKNRLASMSKDEVIQLQTSLARRGYYDLNSDNMTEREIKALQTKLYNKGLLKGDRSKEIDGRIGPKTREAYRKYMTDGIVGSKTTEAYLKSISPAHRWSEDVSTDNTEWCAQWVTKKVRNASGEAFGVTGDAWRMPNNIVKAGGEMLYNIYDDNTFNNVKGTDDLKSKTVKAINNNPFDISQLQVGDVVGIYMPSSDMHETALNNGTTYNTHVGVVTGFNKDGVPIIEHNIHKNHHRDRADHLTGSKEGSPRIATVTRPAYSTPNVSTLPIEEGVSPYVQEGDHPLFKEYADGVAGAKSVIGKMFPNADMDAVEQAVLAVQGRETNFMRTKGSDLTGVDKLKYKAREFYRDKIKETDPEAVSSDLNKMKLSSFTPNERHLLGIKKPSDLNNPELAGRAATYMMAKNYDYFKRLSIEYPELGLTEDDLRYLTELSYNQGMDKLKTIGFDEKGNIKKSEIETIREMAKPNAKVKDISSTNYRHLGAIGKFLYDKFGSAHTPYISAAEKYRSQLLSRLQANPEGVIAQAKAFGGNLFDDLSGTFKATNKVDDMNIFNFGGGLTHGSDWDTGINWVDEGGSHGENPLGGVPMGVDEQGIPNLVEEGEAIWNEDYVFSKRMKVPKKLREKYHLPDDATFADAVARLTKSSDERPLSSIDRNTQDYILGEFADTQEEMRMAKAQRAMEKQQQLQDDFLMGMQFGLGGHMSPIGIVPDSDNISIFDRLENAFADGGGIHIDPSKRGTFKAQASKMGMGVQEAASHILANKEDYSPAMVKKANFAKNFAHAFGGSLFDNPFGEANTFDFGGDLKTRRDTIMRNSGVTEEQANTMLFRMLSKEDRERVIKERVFGTWIPTYNSNMEIVVPTSTTSNRGNVNEGTSQSAAPSQKSGTKPKATSSVTTKPKGVTGLNLYDWYRNGSDGISEPTGFKVGQNGKAYDYTQEYRDLVNSLGADDIRKWAAEHPDDLSLKSFLAKGNDLSKLTDDQWRTGATDGKYGFMHHVADSLLGGNDEFEEVVEPTLTRAAEDPEWAVDFGDPEVMRNIEAGLNPDGTPTSNVGTTRSGFKPKQTWTRQIPIWMSGFFGLKDLLTPADYGNADAITEAAYRVGTPVSIGTEYIGDYRKRDPFDERYLMNIINQRGAATNRNFMNLSGGNRAVAMSGILANDLTTQMSLAEAARQSYLANREDDAKVSEFNRGTNIFNAQAQNQRNQFLAGLNSQRQNAMLSGISMGARMRQAIKDQRDAAISANLTNFAQNIGELGRENGFYNMLGGLNDEGILKYFYGDNYTTKFNA